MVMIGGFFSLWLAAPAAGAATPAETPRTYTVGVVPQHKPADLAARWTPLLRYLGEKTGLRLEFRTARDISTFEHRLAQGEFDIAYMNPFHYAVFHQKTGYRVFARERGQGLRGIVVVRADASYRYLQDLRDRSLAFPAPSAFAASLVPRAQLRAEGVRVSARFVVSHDSVYYGVIDRLFDAGGGALETLARLDPAQRAQLRVLWTSPPYTPHAIAAHPRVPPAVATALRDALIAARADARGRRLLATLGFEELMAASDAEYDPIRQFAPTIRAEICALPESPGDSRALHCPTSFAGQAVRVRAPVDMRYLP